MYFFVLISFFWFIRESRALLFWLYLWQLKDYHIGRFLDHFRTEKGRKLFLSPFVILKIILLFYALFLSRFTKLLPWQLYAIWILILIILYLFESLKFFQDIFQKTFKKPVLTHKTLILISLALIVEISFLYILFQNFYFVLFKNFYWFTFSLLIFDLLTPLIISIIVFFVQPFTVIFFRNQIIKKARQKRADFKNLLVIGITGSYGKTSTKEFLAEILAKKFKLLKTKEHQNSEVGISQCILNDLTNDHQVFICEMAAYNKGGIKLLSEIVKPKIGIIAGINEQHLATFGSMENLISAEGGKELIENLSRRESKNSLLWGLPEDGLVIFNGNSKRCLELFKETKSPKKLSGKKLTIVDFSPEDNFDIWADNIKVEKESLSFKVFSKDKDSAAFKVNLLGAQNIENILLAACCAKELGLNLEEISKACQKIKPFPHQMELKKGKNGINIIDSTYSANPDGVISHLEYLKVWPAKKIIIMPCLIELGKASQEAHKRIGEKIGEVCDLAIITTKERFKEIKEGAMKKGMKEENISVIEKPKKIFEKIKNFFDKEDIILLEGRLPKPLIEKLFSYPNRNEG